LQRIYASIYFCPYGYYRLYYVKTQARCQGEICLLLLNQAIGETLKGSQMHSYKIKMKAGNYFHVEADQRSIDVLFALLSADGKVILEYNWI
jgi:hypothetical protein